MNDPNERYDVCVIGGAGHVGAPLAILLANSGLRTLVCDVNEESMALLKNGQMPFFEEGGEPLLRNVLDAKMLGFSADPKDVNGIPYLIITIGTPVDEFHNPMLRVLTDCFDSLLPFITDEQTVILRSTVFPGATDFLHRYTRTHGKRLGIAFCPERVVQGLAIKEMQELPQIVSATTPEAEAAAIALFSRIAPGIVQMVPAEAEFSKLICNAYRYIQFASANQFYMMAESAGLDFQRVLDGLKQDYPRMRDFPQPGFASGPCLYKDTLQLAAFASHRFSFGDAAIQINEGIPAYIVEQLAARYPLDKCTVGLLGMAFKSNSDDRRASLSYKLKKLLVLRAARVITTDPFVKDDPQLLAVEDVVAQADVLVMCTPHSVYVDLDLDHKPVLDIWNFLPKDAPKARTWNAAASFTANEVSKREDAKVAVDE